MLALSLASFFITIVTLILIITLSHKHDYFMDESDKSRPQNYHSHTTPRAGGLGIFAGLLLFVLSPFALKLLLPISLAFLSGIFEDFHNSLSPRRRLALQIIAALSAVWLTDSVVTYLGLGISMPYWAGVIFSIFAIVGMMNAVNIIDGFNGLASGIILLILLSFAIVSYTQHDMDIFYILLTTIGAILAFLFLNFPKGKIFLGDGGAYMLGFIVAIIGIFLASTYERVSPWYILAIFIYPVWEVIFSIIRKLYIGLSPMQPDSYHLHMLIYRHITKNNPLTSLFILGTTIPFMTLSTIFPNKSISNIFISLTFIICYCMLYYILYKKEKKVSLP
ncbi:MAG: undecaprenyl/decaprenyl-phosphate alpha-N-acetylglucosaminyl 1-phosphate transferase [Sulfurovum sp.]|nr:undecaprenyl/decaprenyl-phosphate alpha-N-acetylglucosaminyl 1-phosphate transferase [Sulfurovum sp.]